MMSAVKDHDLYSEHCRYTMDELREQRENLMTQRMKLIDRHKKLSKRLLLKPYLVSAQPPTPPPVERTKKLEYPWINNIVTSLVYDAVREVEVSRPARERIAFYDTLSKDYDVLVRNFLSQTLKQQVVGHLFEQVWSETLSREMKVIVKQCIGDVNVAESFASNWVLQSVLRVCEREGDSQIFEVAKNLLSDLCLDRAKRKEVVYRHRLQLSLIDIEGLEEVQEIEREDTNADADVISAAMHFDVRSLEPLYHPPLFDRFCEGEVGLWKHLSSTPVNLPVTSPILHSTISPSLLYVAMATKQSIHIFHTGVPHKQAAGVAGEGATYLAWYGREDVILSSNNSLISSWSLTGKNLNKEWSFGEVTVEKGPQKGKIYKPLWAVPVPIYTSLNDQCLFYVVCEENVILRVLRTGSDPDFPSAEYPIPRNKTADGSLVVDVCKGHTSPITDIVVRDEVSFLSIAESVIIEWEYIEGCFDAFGYVIPLRTVVSGADLQFTRLVKGATEYFDVKNAKTRQEVVGAARTTEEKISQLGLGSKPISRRVNTESGLVESTFVSSDVGEPEVDGIVVIRKTIGNSLFSAKYRMFKPKWTPPTKLLGVAVSPGGDLAVFCYLFADPLYSTQPYLSLISLRTRDLTFTQNKVRVFLNPEQAASLSTAPQNGVFAMCLTPPHHLSRSHYLLLRIGRTLSLVSMTTSAIIRAGAGQNNPDVSERTQVFSDKSVNAVWGDSMRCVVWGDGVLVTGTNSKQGLVFSIRTPEKGQTFEVYRDQLASSVRVVDPLYRRFFVREEVCWGKWNQNQSDAIDTSDFMKELLVAAILKRLP
eukprot:sb/3462136/